MPKIATDWSGYQYSFLKVLNLYRLNHGCPSERLLEEPDTARRFTT